MQPKFRPPSLIATSGIAVGVALVMPILVGALSFFFFFFLPKTHFLAHKFVGAKDWVVLVIWTGSTNVVSDAANEVVRTMRFWPWWPQGGHRVAQKAKMAPSSKTYYIVQ